MVPPLDPPEGQRRADTRFSDATAEMCAHAHFSEIWTAGLHPEGCGALIRLVEEPWHTRHEDTVRGKQLRCAGAVPALERAAHAIYEDLD
jgi:hypothetical protein